MKEESSISRQSSGDSPLNSHAREGQGEQAAKPRGRVVALGIYIGTIALLVIIAIGLGVGLGVGLPRKSKTLTVYKDTNANFNYSSFYGIPDVLPLVDSAKLVNQEQLDLQTGFEISNVTTIREYTLNITQNLAAPDGTILRI